MRRIRVGEAERTSTFRRSQFSQTLFDEAYPDGIAHHFWHLARNRLVEAALRQSIDRESRALEIGCGPGLVLQHLRSRGLDCWGCELGDPPLADVVRPFVFVQQDFRNLDAAFCRTVCSLLLLDVIEHIPDDIGFLRDLVETFPNGRSLILTVPARQELWSNYDAHYGHYRRYSQTTLMDVLNDSGFAVVYQRYFFQELYAPMLLAARLAGHRRTGFRAPAYPGLHRTLAVLSGLCSALIPGSWPGSSLLAFAVRRDALP